MPKIGIGRIGDSKQNALERKRREMMQHNKLRNKQSAGERKRNAIEEMYRRKKKKSKR